MDHSKYDELIERARYYGKSEKWDKCIEFYERAFEILIKTEDLLDLALAYLQTDNSYRAVKAIDAVIESYPDNYQGYFYKGIYYDHLLQSDEALNCYREALTRYRKETDDEKELSEIYFKIGRIYDQKADKEADSKEKYRKLSEKYYLLCLDKDKNNYYANLNLGSLYDRTDDTEKALYYTMRSHDIDPDEKMSAYNLGVIYGKMHDYRKAIAYYLEETKKKDFHPFAYYNLGIIYKDSCHDLQKAKECYIEALKYLRYESSVWYNLGCVYVLENDFENAGDCFYCAAVLNPEVISFMEKDPEIKAFSKSPDFGKLKTRTEKKKSKEVNDDRREN